MNSPSLGDLLPLTALIAAVGVPFAIERYVFRKRMGPFQILFWIFVAQWSALGVGMAIVAGFGLGTTAGQIGQILAGLGFIAIGLVPFVLLPIAVIAALAWLGWRRIQGMGRSG